MVGPGKSGGLFVVRPGRFFIRGIFARMSLQQRRARPNESWTVSTDVLADVAWWHTFAQEWNGISLLYEREWTSAEKIELFTDACGSGLGALLGNEWIEARWTAAQRAAAMRAERDSMPFFEMLALVTAACTWSSRWKGKKILFRSDCEQVVYCVNSGSSDDPGMMRLLRVLALTACRQQFDFRCVHIPGVLNVAADLLSRYGDCPQFRTACPAASPVMSVIGVVPL